MEITIVYQRAANTIRMKVWFTSHFILYESQLQIIAILELNGEKQMV
jgi:hypothetical protein